MAKTVDMTAFPMWIDGDFDEDFYLIAARVNEGLSRVSEITMEFACTKADLDLESLLGKQLRAVFKTGDRGGRMFPGTCVSVESAGRSGGLSHYIAEVRPWLWFLGRTKECRIFQSMSVVEIFEEIMGDYNFGGRFSKSLNDTYDVREYTVQYRETDFDFLSRLFEEAGIFYFFRGSRSGEEEMVLADDVGSYQVSPGAKLVPFRASGDAAGGLEFVYEWDSGLGATSGKVTLWDYDFEKPNSKLESTSTIEKGSHTLNDREVYHYPGHFRDSSLGDKRAKIRMQAEAVRHEMVAGAGNFAGFRVGHKFGVTDLAREADCGPDAWMMVAATHLMKQPIEIAGWPDVTSRSGIAAATGDDLYRIDFEAIPASEQYRAPLVTPWPEITGVQTAVVVRSKNAPADEEIDTDDYGRVLVRFHWDRKHEDGNPLSCRVRCMTPWAGANFGAVAIPRIGSEVVVQFEEGDPDRPLVTGMVYNASSMPPYSLPGNKTQSGIKTNSSKGGGGFNELMMEDKAGAELVRFQSERDYTQIVKNDADITVGLEHKDKGDMSLEVHRHLTEKLNTGDHSFTVAAGKQTLSVKKDKTETVEGKSTQTVTGNVTETIKQGNYDRTIDMGNETHKLKMGNLTRTLDMGNVKSELKMGGYTVKTSLGKQMFDSAVQGIELKCGASSIKIDMTGVTIKGLMVTVEGTVMTTVKGAITEVNGSGMAMIKGGVLMIN